MSKFHTDADLIRYHARKFMGDCKEHTIKEILAYIHQVHGEKGVTGEILDYRKVRSAFQPLLNMESNDYVTVRRGVYKKLHKSERYSMKTVCQNISGILAQAKQDIKIYLGKNFKLSELSLDIVRPFQIDLRAVDALLDQAGQIMDDHAKRGEAAGDEHSE